MNCEFQKVFIQPCEFILLSCFHQIFIKSSPRCTKGEGKGGRRKKWKVKKSFSLIYILVSTLFLSCGKKFFCPPLLFTFPCLKSGKQTNSGFYLDDQKVSCGKKPFLHHEKLFSHLDLLLANIVGIIPDRAKGGDLDKSWLYLWQNKYTRYENELWKMTTIIFTIIKIIFIDL